MMLLKSTSQHSTPAKPDVAQKFGLAPFKEAMAAPTSIIAKGSAGGTRFDVGGQRAAK
jgi:hypothetical protein